MSDTQNKTQFEKDVEAFIGYKCLKAGVDFELALQETNKKQFETIADFEAWLKEQKK